MWLTFHLAIQNPGTRSFNKLTGLDLRVRFYKSRCKPNLHFMYIAIVKACVAHKYIRSWYLQLTPYVRAFMEVQHYYEFTQGLK